MKPKHFPVLCLTLLVLVCLPSCTPDETPEPGARIRTSAGLVSFDSCAQLAAALKANLKEEMRVQLLRCSDVVYLDSPIAGPTDEAPEDTADGAGRTEGTDYSGTNNQEAGVDESDFVKTDGFAIYVLNGGSFMLFDVPAFGMLEAGASLPIEGTPGQMLLHADSNGGRATRAVVFSNIYAWDVSGDHPQVSPDGLAEDRDSRFGRGVDLTKITVIDLSNPASPSVLRELYLEGYLQTARRIGSGVHMVSYAWLTIDGLRYWPELPEAYYRLPYDSPNREAIWNDAVWETIAFNDALIDALELADLVPVMYEVQPGKAVVARSFTGDACSRFTVSADGAGRGFTSLLSFDLSDNDTVFTASHIVSNQSIVYASPDSLLIAEPAQDWWWYWGNDELEEATNIHRFDISATGAADYSGSGRLPGTVLNQFSLSEHNAYIRVAATTGQWNRWWMAQPAEPENYVYVLNAADNGSLAVIGQVGPLAPGEIIWSARFVEDQAFLVTFETVDPLFTIDLSDPLHPHVKGELKVPGVSTYVHPVDDDRLLTIGYGGDETGLDWSIVVSLFDVSDFSRPALIDSLRLSPPAGEGWDAWSSSEAVYEHKAFQYWAPRGLLAVPLSTSRSAYAETPDGYTYTYEYLSRLQLITVDPQQGLSLYGSIDHSDFYNSDAGVYWCSQDIRRSIFMGDFIYALSDKAVTAGALDDPGAILQAATLPGTNCGYWYGGGIVDDTPGDEPVQSSSVSSSRAPTPGH